MAQKSISVGRQPVGRWPNCAEMATPPPAPKQTRIFQYLARKFRAEGLNTRNSNIVCWRNPLPEKIFWVDPHFYFILFVRADLHISWSAIWECGRPDINFRLPCLAFNAFLQLVVANIRHNTTLPTQIVHVQHDTNVSPQRPTQHDTGVRAVSCHVIRLGERRSSFQALLWAQYIRPKIPDECYIKNCSRRLYYHLIL